MGCAVFKCGNCRILLTKTCQSIVWYQYTSQVLGILGLLDKSETDWKVLVINAEEAKEKNISSIADLDNVYPDLSLAIRNFFRIYKVPSGKPENKFAFDGEFKDSEFAKEVIR